MGRCILLAAALLAPCAAFVLPGRSVQQLMRPMAAIRMEEGAAAEPEPPVAVVLEGGPLRKQLADNMMGPVIAYASLKDQMVPAFSAYSSDTTVDGWINSADAFGKLMQSVGALLCRATDHLPTALPAQAHDCTRPH